MGRALLPIILTDGRRTRGAGRKHHLYVKTSNNGAEGRASLHGRQDGTTRTLVGVVKVSSETWRWFLLAPSPA